MTYRVVFHAKADAETIGLPAEAFTALVETLGAVSRDPYDQAVTLATEDPHIRRAKSGQTSAHGMVLGVDPASIVPGLRSRILVLRRVLC